MSNKDANRMTVEAVTFVRDSGLRLSCLARFRSGPAAVRWETPVLGASLYVVSTCFNQRSGLSCVCFFIWFDDSQIVGIFDVGENGRLDFETDQSSRSQWPLQKHKNNWHRDCSEVG